MIQIYDIEDKLLLQAEITSAAKREQEMSKTDYISLSFSTAEKVVLPVGAYINYTYKIDKVREVTRKFLLLEAYEPSQTDEMSWKYTPEFQHPKMILSKTPFYIYTRNSQNEEIKQNIWSFVGTTSVLSGKIADFLNKDLMFGECGWKVIFSNVTANTVNVSFSDNDFISALTAITNAIGDNCEWHIDYDDEIIYIGKVLIGATPVILEVGKNVGVPNISNSKESYYNAFSIFGGTRNITQVNSKGENVSSGDIRLQLDEGNGTILIDGKERSYSIDKYSTLDLRADKMKEPLFTKVLDFSQIYPSLNTYVYNVRGRVKYVLDDKKKKIPISYNADGSVKEYKTFTVWYMRLAYLTTEKVEGKTIINTTVDDGVTHYWYDFEVTDDLLINGKNIGCSFEPNFNTGALSTPLAGRGSNGDYVGFELIYHKDAISSHTSDDVDKNPFSIKKGDYEIIYQEDNDIIIPTNAAEMLIPRGESKPSLRCNITVLYNIAMADTIYYKDAQNRLLEKAKEEIVRLLSDLNNYEIKSYSDVFLKENPELQIGQSVTYKDGHGYELATRVLKLSTNIDFGFIQTITLGNQVIKGTITQLKEDVQSIIASGGSNGNGGGFTVSQLRNLIAKYGSDNFISKQFDDTAQGLITFLKGLKSQDVIKAVNGISLGYGESYVNGNGDAKLTDVVVDRIHDKNSTPSDRVIIGAQGFDFYMGDDGKSHLYVDYLTARTRMFASSVEIRKVSYSGGTTIFSNAGSQIAKVSYIYDAAKEKVIAYKCYAVADDGTTKTMNWWHVGMMALCQTFNVKSGELEKLENRYYWRLVVGVGQEKIEGKLYDYVVLSNLQTFHGNDNVIPYFNTGAQFGNGFPIAFGATLVSTTGDMEMKSLAYIFQDQEGKTTDDSNTAIADRVFYGYETVDGDREPDAPQAYDVIVQVGNQIQWKKYGNVIKLSTSTEDNATDNAPAITMYHKMGAPNVTGDTDENGNPVINPYLWRTVTAVISPEIVMYNTDIYKLFQGTPDNIVDPIVVTFDIIPSAQYITRHPVSRTTTPSNITFRVRRRTGNAVDYIDNAKIYACINGSEEGTLLSTKQLSDLGTIYDMNSVSLYATVNAVEAGKPYDKRVAELDIPVLTDGDKGIDGTDALEVTIKNAPLVFDTNDNGVVSSSAVQTAEIWIAREGKNVIADIKQPSITGSLNFTIGSDNAVIRKTSECLQIILKGIGIAKESINGNYVSKTSGYVVVSFNDGTNPFKRQILFNVNVARFNSSVIQTAKLYQQKYTEVSNKYEALPEEVRNKESFTEYNSAIKQTARGISLSVTEEAAKKRNLLVNSDFVRNGGFYIYLNPYATIERYDSHNDENVFYSYPLNQALYSKLMWEGSKVGDTDRGSQNIPIVIGKKYTISCWAKVSDTSVPLTLQVYSQAAQTGNSATASKGDLLNQEVTLDAANEWQLISYTFEVKGNYSYCSVRLFFQPLSSTRIKGYISQPMLEQSDSYNGWTLAEEDYVYRNGNMLDNTRYFNTGGNLITVGTIYNNVKDNCSMSEASVDMVTTARRTGTLLGYKLPLEAYTDYVLSFYIRSKDIDSKQNVICTIIQDSGVFFAEALMQKEKETVGILSNYTSLNGNTTTSGYVSFSSIPTEWTKVSYHFSLNTKNTAQSISILAYAQNGAGTLQICQPKLEKSVTNTAWTEAKQDVAFKDKYKRAGIDFDSETIRLSAERTIIDGDMHLKGILIENTAEPVKADFFPIVCDLKQNKSIAVGTYTGTENYGTGSENKFVVLPMYDDTSCINENGKETIVAGLKESGVKLSIFSKYNPNVAKWATANRYRYLDTAQVWGMPPYQILHAAITVVYADPRIAFKKNYYDFTNESDGTTSVSATIKPQGDGTPSYKAKRGYKHGCFVCNGRRGRMLLLMPGQTLHITSSIEKWNGENVLMWYIDNASEFVPVSKQVIFERDSNQKDYTYTWVNLGYTNSDQSNDSSFPGDFVNNDTNLVYEDVLFAPPQLSRDYPASDEWGMDKVQSGEALTIPLF